MRCLFDVNMLIATLDRMHAMHAAALSWIGAQAGLNWASCPVTENGLIRIMAQPAYGAPVPPRESARRLKRSIADTDHEFWPDDVSIVDDGVIRHERLVGHRQITDAYLLALAVKHGGRLVTFDRALPIDAVIGATAEHVVTLGG